MALTARTRNLVDHIARELAASLAAMTGSATAEVAPAPAATVAPRWLLSVALNGGDGGHLAFGLDEAGARAATRLVLGADDDPSDEAVVDTLREFGSQAVGTVSQDPVHGGLRFEVALELAEAPPPPHAAIYTLSVGATVPLVVWAWGEMFVGAGEGELASAALLSDPVQAESQAIQGRPPNLDVILDVDLPISVRFGMTEMALQSLTRIGPGSVIDLARSPDDPVELLISGKVVARGEVVVVMGNYGVRITEVVSPADRIRSMGASR